MQKNDVFLKDFKGYYGNTKANEITIKGNIKDYTHSFRTDVKIKTRKISKINIFEFKNKS